LGFNYCGIAKAEFLNDDARRLEHWLNKGSNGTMQYMENYFDLRVNPQKIVPYAKSVITLLQNYYPEQQQQNNNYKVAKYAYGKDYHEIIRAKLKQLLTNMNATIGSIDGRGFVDSAPVLERAGQ
jgi:epoxyqueuosine reductase